MSSDAGDQDFFAVSCVYNNEGNLERFPERLRSEAAWAHLCGVAPIEASSGKVTRHRLDRGGNRQANAALFRIVLVRIAHDPDTKAYIERRTKEGRSKLEVIRILKRYVAREVYRHLPRR